MNKNIKVSTKVPPMKAEEIIKRNKIYSEGLSSGIHPNFYLLQKLRQKKRMD